MSILRNISIALTLVLGAASAQAQTWSTVKVADSVTVQMPGTPVVTDRGGQKGSELKLADSTAFSYMLIDFSQFGLDEDMLQGMVDSDQFTEQYRTGITSQGGEIVSEKTGKVKDTYTWYEYEIKTAKDGKETFSTIRTVFYKAWGIALVYRGGLKGKDAAVMNKYFDSIKIGG